MKCPHCLVTVHLGQINSQSLGFDHTEETVQFAVKSINCPNCNRLIAWLNKSWGYQSRGNSIGVPLPGIYQNSEEMLIWPNPESTEPSGGGAGKGPDGDGDGIVLADFGWKAPVVDLLSAE